MRHILCALSLVALLVGCGGGGGGAPPAFEPPPVDLGLVASGKSTAFQTKVVNPFGTNATVTLATASAGIAATGGQLPLVLPGGAEADVDLQLTPSSSGSFAGSVTLELDTGSQTNMQATDVSATVEARTASLSVTTLDFGFIPLGGSADRSVTFSNTSSLSDVTLSAATVPDPAYTLLSPTLPTTLTPGQAATLQIRCTPTGLGAPSGALPLVSNATNGPFSVSLSASSGGQDIVTFDNEAFDGSGDTRELTFDAPSDTIAFMIEATTAAGTELGLRLLTGPGGKEYEREALDGPYIWSVQSRIFNAQVPNTDRSDVQLVPSGGTYRFKLLRWSGSAGDCDIRVIIQRRPDADTRELATLDLNVFLAAGIAPTAATAESDSTLQTVLSSMGNILSQQGVQLGDIDYYDVTDTTYDDVTWSEFGDMLELSSAATEPRLNLFFVRTAIGGGILGVSPTLGGPSVNGTELSGVMSLYSTNNPTFIGLVAAHEIGHFLGLAHTVEETGGHDDIVDTLECPASGTDSICTTVGGGYLMHWQAVGGTTITDGQGLVARGHPHMGPRFVPPEALQAKPSAPQPVSVPAGTSEQWCGTCKCMHRTPLK